MNTSSFFGITAGLVAVLTYSQYLRQTIKGQSEPNPSTWAIWLLVGIINAFTYFSVTNKNLWQSFIVISVTISVLVIFFYSIINCKFSKINNIEIVVFIFALAIGFFWQITSNARIANLILQIVYVISYIPTATGIISGKSKEHYAAWIAAFSAYLLSTISIALDPNVDWIAFIHPLINGLLGNGIIVGIIFYKNSKY